MIVNAEQIYSKLTDTCIFLTRNNQLVGKGNDGTIKYASITGEE